MNPLQFVGQPDWRSAVLAAAFAVPWLVLLVRKWLLRPWTWTVIVAAAIFFPLSIAWVQVPIQNALNALWLRVAPAAVLQRWLLLIAVPSIVVTALVQEPAKFVLAVAGLRLLRARDSRLAGQALGAAAGAGYGAMEAFWTMNMIFANGFTRATVQLYGVAALAGFIERVFAVMFHIAVAALAGYGYSARRPWRFLLLAIGLHSLSNYITVLLQARLLNVVAVEIILAAIAMGTLAAAVALRARLDGGEASQEQLARPDDSA